MLTVVQCQTNAKNAHMVAIHRWCTGQLNRRLTYIQAFIVFRPVRKMSLSFAACYIRFCITLCSLRRPAVGFYSIYCGWLEASRCGCDAILFFSFVSSNRTKLHLFLPSFPPSFLYIAFHLRRLSSGNSRSRLRSRSGQSHRSSRRNPRRRGHSSQQGLGGSPDVNKLYL